jgi:hypothetical protein
MKGQSIMHGTETIRLYWIQDTQQQQQNEKTQHRKTDKPISHTDPDNKLW